MQSYSSPGRVITVQNSGPGAVEVRRDQPYRLRGLVGVTQHSAKVDAALNLCVEGTYDQFVTLPAGAQPVESGEAVLMHVGTFVLIAGISADDDHIPFGLLGERIVATGLASVKLMPGTGAAAGGGGGGTDPAVTKRVGDVEQAVIALGQSVEATSGAVSGFDGRLDQAEADIDALQATGGTGGGTQVTVVDISSPGTNQVTFGGLHTDSASASQRLQNGAIRFNRHVYSSGTPLVTLNGNAWMTVAEDGFYEVEVGLTLLDQTLDRGGIGFLYETLQIQAPDGSTPSIAPSYGTRNTMSAGLQEYLDECAAQGQGASAERNRGDIAWFNGANAPYTDRRFRATWRVFLRAGTNIRIFGSMTTAGFYRTVQIAYGGVTAGDPANGTPALRFSNPVSPTLRITRFA